MEDIPAHHQQLIARLTERGIYATFRRWAMGDTVFVGGRKTEDRGIRCFERAAYLVSVEGGGWQIVIDIFEAVPMPEDAVVECVARLLFDDAEYERELKAQTGWRRMDRAD